MVEQAVEGRAPARRKQEQERHFPEQRMFFFGQLLSPTARTSTVFSTVSSTATVVSLLNCIPDAYFNANGKDVTCGSTRKRQIEEQQLVAPSQVVQ